MRAVRVRSKPCWPDVLLQDTIEKSLQATVDAFSVQSMRWSEGELGFTAVLQPTERLEDITNKLLVEWALNQTVARVGHNEFEERILLGVRPIEVGEVGKGIVTEYEQFVTVHNETYTLQTPLLRIRRVPSKGILRAMSSLVPGNLKFEIPPRSWFEDVRDEERQIVSVEVVPDEKETWKVRFMKPYIRIGEIVSVLTLTAPTGPAAPSQCPFRVRTGHPIIARELDRKRTPRG